MATITEKNVTDGGQQAVHTIVSGAATVASSDTIDLQDLPMRHPHVFLGVKLYDGSGDEITDGSASGTFTVSVGTENNGHLEAPPTATIDASAPVTIDWAANTRRVTVSGASLTGITTWRVVLTMNRS